MLHEFLTANREELARRCRSMVAERAGPHASPVELKFGIPIFIGQLIDTLRTEQLGGSVGPLPPIPTNIGTVAEKHGYELLRKGFTVDQVVHDYGDLCQVLTELAHETDTVISVEEFHTFNRCLDDAIADAVTEFGRARDQDIALTDLPTMNERLGALARELRNQLNTASLAFEAIRNGSVALSGATGAALVRSLSGLRAQIDRPLADVRLTAGLQPGRESLSLVDVLEDARVPAMIEAKAKGIALSTIVATGLMVHADRQMLSSAVANVLQNALKLTPPKGRVELGARALADRVLIEIKDECGGLPPGAAESFGLSVSRRAIEANGGTLHVQDLPGLGCIFTIDLPRPATTN